jgi:serine/threonine-protein kinase
MKNPSQKILYPLFVILFLLTACGSKQTATPTAGKPEPAATQTQMPTQPAATFTLAAVEPSITPTAALPAITPVPTLAVSGELAAGSSTTGEDGATLVFVPEGDFFMGANANDLFEVCGKFRSDCRREWFTNVEPERTVTLDAFWIDQTEVTNKMYAVCVDADKCTPPFQSNSYTRENYFGNSKYDEYPVIYVSWNQADAYCAWAGRRLPTEAEWEKAARGKDGFLYPWGNTALDKSRLNYGLNVGDTSPVKQYPGGISPYGAYDMAGNAWEWVADWYDENYYKTAPSANPMGPDSGKDKVSRGGAWVFYDFDMFSTDRYGNSPQVTNNTIGFRCARSR